MWVVEMVSNSILVVTLAWQDGHVMWEGSGPSGTVWPANCIKCF